MNIFLIFQLVFAIIMLVMYVVEIVYYVMTKDLQKALIFYIIGVLCFIISTIFKLIQKA